MGHFGDIGRLDGFADRLSRAFRRLSMCGVRVSVFAVSVPGITGRDLFRLLNAALSDAYEVGQIDIESVGIIYYGPRPGSSDADTKAMFLRDIAGLLPVNPMTPASHPRVQVLHVSTAQVVDTPELVAALLSAPIEPAHRVFKRRAA